MANRELNVVTGSFGYTGKYITRRLLERGIRVRTLTGRPKRANPFGEAVEVSPFNFDRPEELAKSMAGATTLFNTYWVRFPHGQVSYQTAVLDTLTLIEAAQKAGVQRLVHISITGAAPGSPLPYFAGKGQLEEAIKNSGLSYAILRPTVIFGYEDILINNIAWLLRRFPVFAVPGTGDYKLQPVFVEDLAELAVQSARSSDNLLVDAVGPETYTFNELVRLIRDTIRSLARIVHINPHLAYLLSRIIGVAVRDVVLTRDEVKGLMANLLVSNHHPTCWTRLSHWLEQHGHRVGVAYASELNRHYKPLKSI